MKKIIKRIMLLLISFFLMFNVSLVKADSGWDTDYDTSDWDTSDWDDDWDSDYSGSYDSGDGIDGGLFIIIFIIVFIIIISKNNGNKNNNGGSGSAYSKKSNNYNDLTEEELKKYNINSKELKDYVFKMYKDIQNAWTDLDYDKLRSKLTDELYNSYSMQLDTLKLKHQKNIMSDFECIDTKIYKVFEENGIINVNIYLNVKMYDYVIDKDNNVLRGNDKRRIDIEYELTFVKSSSDVKKDTICPNCGAKIESVAGGTCEYCGSVIVEDAKEYVLSRKTAIGQRFE